MKFVRVRIKNGWDQAGRIGHVIGKLITTEDGMSWTPVLWEGEEDPDWSKSSALEEFDINAPKIKDD